MQFRLVAAFMAAGLAFSPAFAEEARNQQDIRHMNPTKPAAPPVAEKREHSYTHHGITLSDPYHWLKDQSYPVIDDEDILDYVKAENAWFETQMAPRQALVDTLFEELKGRIKEDDSSVPQKDGDWLYWREFEEGDQYRRHYRKPVAGGEAQLILDENELAKGLEYFALGAMSITKNGRYLAYSADTNANERYDVRIKDLETGELLADTITDTNSNLVWLKGDTMLAYGRANEQWRVENVRLHTLGSTEADDVEIFTENELGFTVGKGLSAQEDWLIISTGNHDTREVWMVRADDPTGEQVLVRKRKAGVEYSVDIREGTVFIHANDTHPNFRLATAPISDPGDWATLIEGSDEFYLTDFDLFEDLFVTEGRLDGLEQVQLRSYEDPTSFEAVEFPEASYTAGLSDNPEYAVDKLRLSYQSMVTPASVYDYQLENGELELLKQQEIPSGYDASLYETERLMITACDGTEVPVSVMIRKDRDAINGGAGGPLYIMAYGSYGHASDPYFSTSRLSLLDRGMAFAIAHVRGGGELGKRWHEAGKLLQRKNTFADFVDVARALIDRGISSEGKIVAYSGSAGGTLMGAVANSDPELWGAVIADVPFVDVLNTMLDKDLPLTPGEWPEWGNPYESKEAFEYIRSYSPYENTVAQDYPPMLVLAGLNDPRVTYWEPAKWVAKLRDVKTDDNELLLKTEMGAGHLGKSGRWDFLKEVAEQYAWTLWTLGIKE
ncbi:S9 family peptidase [Altererythrobacter sp. MF3-039]|uniref:S9 family peptidase n=1 Tax=Altererythrobacter sp. MF3-039 TaxID=3252901 RepID=UPI00390C919A